MTDWAWPHSKIDYAVDGDSFFAYVTRDIGFHGTTTFRVKLRLARIDAPKLKSPGGADAKKAFEQMTLDPVNIVTTGPYKYGDEWMAEVTLPNGANLSDELVSQGYAVYWNGVGPRPGG